jgi:hypothetical protein
LRSKLSILPILESLGRTTTRLFCPNSPFVDYVNDEEDTSGERVDTPDYITEFSTSKRFNETPEDDPRLYHKRDHRRLREQNTKTRNKLSPVLFVPYRVTKVDLESDKKMVTHTLPWRQGVDKDDVDEDDELMRVKTIRVLPHAMQKQTMTLWFKGYCVVYNQCVALSHE